jgi:hypothetical protein
MTPEEWPIWTPHDRGRSPVLRAGSDRLPTVRQDFFLDADHRLTEQERALMTAMLHRLVADIASEIQLALPGDWLPANDDVEALIDRISKAGLLDLGDLLGLFLRRADEQRIAFALDAVSRPASANLIHPFVSDEQGGIAAAAMAVLMARGRRRDRYGRTIVELDDIPPQTAEPLVYAVAAGFRESIPVHLPAGRTERQLCDAATVLIRRQEPSRALDSQMEHLVSLLGDAGRLDDALIDKAIELGDLNFLAHALGRRASLHHDVSFDELMSCNARRAMMVLRLADCPRSTAAQLLATLGDFMGLGGDTQTLDAFSAWTAEQLEAARNWLQLEQAFQTALRGVGHGNGHRAH